MSTANNPELLSQAQHLWKFLDSLAESDPAAYQQFIDKQVKERKQLKQQQQQQSQSQPEQPPPLFLPQPLFVVQCLNASSSGHQPVVVNLCVSSQVEPILTQQRKPATVDEIRAMHGLLIPLSVSAQRSLSLSVVMREGDRKSPLTEFNIDVLNALQSMPQCQPTFPLLPLSSPSAKCAGFDIVFNPSTMVHASQSLSLMLTVLNVAFEHIVKDNPNIKLSEQFRVLSGVTYIGESQHQQTKPTKPPQSQAQPQPPKPLSNEIILPTSSVLNSSETKDELPTLKTSAESTSKPLIEMLDGDDDNDQLSVPEYTVENNGEKLIIHIALPNVDSIDALDVEITDDSLSIKGAGYALQLSLPCSVDGEASEAKWLKKKRELKISAIRR